MEEALIEASVNSDGSELIELGKGLMNAARDGDIERVMELMRGGAPFATDWWGRTALHHAAEKGHLEMVKLLIRAGILKDMRSKVDKTPLHLACQEGHAEVAKCLIANGSEVAAADMIFMTPLHWAVEMGHAFVCKILLQNGANPRLLNKFDKSSIDIAKENDNHKLLALLKAGPKPGPHTVTDIMPNLIKQKTIYVNTSPSKFKKVNVTSPVKMYTAHPKTLTMKAPEQKEMWRYLEEHGIEMLEGEDANLVAAALGSGQGVYLTEAGRQALTLTEDGKQRTIKVTTSNPSLTISTSSNNVTTTNLTHPTVNVNVQPMQKFTRIQPTPVVATKRPYPSEAEDLVAISQKYFKSREELTSLEKLYVQKKKETLKYEELLRSGLKATSNSNLKREVSQILLDDDEFLAEEDEEEFEEIEDGEIPFQV